MITIVSHEDVPAVFPQKSEMRAFAEKTLDEFLEVAKDGDFAEVTGAPECEGYYDDRAGKLTNDLRAEAIKKRVHREIKVMKRKNRVFLMRLNDDEGE